jgi:hypothetical protein
MSSGSGSIASSQYAKAVGNQPAYNTHYARGRPGRPKQIVHKKKEKKMSWFKRKFANWVREAWENSHSEEVYATESPRKHEGVTGKSSVRFTIYAAQGGHIIEYYKQDRYKEQDGPELVIVNSDQTIGQAVEHILTMEALKS